MAVIPNLLNPTNIVVSQIIDSETRYDRLRRTPVNRVKRESKFTIKSQIKWSTTMTTSRPMAGQSGVDEQQQSYAIVLKRDLDTLGKTIARGDRITQIESRDVDLFVMRVEYGSHYGGDFSLVKILIEDRTGIDNY